ncbi:acyl homoserine lactone synthase [Loktanella atrilutea]|uniref:Acyl-homoserine-lactone synthase n=1 Tax=Loktanella atrilutea TaxID=366533 RepID=A0A1M4TX59_LOKAT|nr:acyl-homoserine-lactone synthase [Loktanella atrilutea]SHE48964.1 acyl homoserine lactone synthase [Loktanella atrilutea]
MENITFNMRDLHVHGTAFYDFLRLRKRFFVDTLGWHIPHDDDVEMDQYDNPKAWYSVVLRDGEVIGGARAMATTATWGSHSYMLRDAVQGKLIDIPAEVLAQDIVSPDMWECTRLVISDAVDTQAARSTCLTMIVQGLIDVAADQGATTLMSLSPLALMRALRQLGFGAERIGEPYVNDNDGRRYAVLSMPTTRIMPPLPRATHRVQPQPVHAPSV